MPIFLLDVAAQQGQSAGILGSLIPFMLILLIFYFFIIRPQNKKQKETEKMLSLLKKGDKIVTIGGIHGVIFSVAEKTVVVKMVDGAKIEFNRSAVASVVSDSKLKNANSKAEKAKKIKDEKSNSSENAENLESPNEKSETPENKAENPGENSKNQSSENQNSVSENSKNDGNLQSPESSQNENSQS